VIDRMVLRKHRLQHTHLVDVARKGGRSLSAVAAEVVVDVDVEEGCGVDCDLGCLDFGFMLGWGSDGREGGSVGW